jgi:glycosyltransferase involved in cell wall biosynthesis
VLYSTAGTPPTSRFTMVHAGTLTDAKHFARSTAPLFQALHSLLKREPRLVEGLELVFTGFLPAGQRSLVGQLGLSSIVKELGFLPRAEFLRLMHDSDLLVVINYEGYPTLIPGKLYEYWAVGGPPILLLSCPGAAASLVEHHNLGSTVEPSDVVGIEDTILRGYRQKQLGLPIRIKTAGIERYDRKALTVQLAQILSGVSQSEFQASHGQPSQGSRRN